MSTKGAGDANPADRVAAYLDQAQEAIDAAFGEGHAARHPDLVAAFIQAAAVESLAVAGRHASEQGFHVATRIARETNETLLRLKPRFFG